MEKNKKERAPQEKNRIVIEGYDYLGNSASSMDCTGLIPSEPQSDAERESYEALYHYRPRAVEEEKNLKSGETE